MKAFRFILLVLVLGVVHIFSFRTSTRLKQLSCTPRKTSLLYMVAKQREEKTAVEKAPITLREIFTPPYADGFTIGWTLAGQGLLVNLAFISSIIYDFFNPRSIGFGITSFDSQSMLTALYIAGPLISKFKFE